MTETLNSTSLDTIINFIMPFFLVFFIVCFICYIFTSIALYTMGKNKGISYSWIAWIPIVSMFLMGKIINDKVVFGTFVIPSASITLLLCPFVSSGTSFIPIIKWLFPILYLVYNCAAIYRLYRLYKPEKAVLFLVLSIILPFLGAFLFFAIRNNEAKEYLENVN